MTSHRHAIRAAAGTEGYANPFCVLGLSADAAGVDIQQAAQRALMERRLGEATAETADQIHAIEDARERLKDPVARFHAALNWVTLDRQELDVWGSTTEMRSLAFDRTTLVNEAYALAESRKYRTSYLLSTQMLEQLDPATLAGVLGNCGSTLCMTVGPRDADVLAELLGSGLTPDDLMRIPKYHGYLRLLIEGAPHTFSMKTSLPMRNSPNRADIIRRVSRQKFGR
ncbi:MAG: hypothetical protein RIK87_29895 [Fuerstiella sp.]